MISPRSAVRGTEIKENQTAKVRISYKWDPEYLVSTRNKWVGNQTAFYVYIHALQNILMRKIIPENSESGLQIVENKVCGIY